MEQIRTKSNKVVNGTYTLGRRPCGIPIKSPAIKAMHHGILRSDPDRIPLHSCNVITEEPAMLEPTVRCIALNNHGKQIHRMECLSLIQAEHGNGVWLKVTH